MIQVWTVENKNNIMERTAFIERIITIIFYAAIQYHYGNKYVLTH